MQFVSRGAATMPRSCGFPPKAVLDRSFTAGLIGGILSPGARFNGLLQYGSSRLDMRRGFRGESAIPFRALVHDFGWRARNRVDGFQTRRSSTSFIAAVLPKDDGSKPHANSEAACPKLVL